MNPLLKKFAVVLAVGAGGVSIPLVPQELVFTEAYQYPVGSYEEYITPALRASNTDTVIRDAVKNPQEPFEDDNGDGLISVAVFRDKTGGLVYYQISENLYKKMGERNGSSFNPQKTEFVSLLSLLGANQAGAAISIDTSSSTASTGSATSKTLSYTVGSGSNTLLAIGVYAFNHISTVSYNGASTTQYVFYNDSYRYGLYYISSPDVGTYNIVANFGASTPGAISAVSMFGVDIASTSPVHKYATDGFANDNTDRGASLTTTIDGCGVFTWLGQDNGGVVAGDANATLVTRGYGNTTSFDWGVGRSTTFPQTTAGAITVLMDGGAGSWGRSMSIAFAPATEGGGDPVVNATSSTPFIIRGGSFRIQQGTFKNTQL